jgi:hypothetical protein
MATLSELVSKDYDEEVEIIRDAGGNLWLTGLGTAFFFAVMFVTDVILREPWTKRGIAGAILCVIACPFIIRAWERHRVAAVMRHEREVRVEVKLNALLGLVKFDENEWE